MIAIFIGEDTRAARKAMQKAVADISPTNSEVNVQRFIDVGFDAQLAREAVFAQNLFTGSNTVVFDGILDAKESENFYSEDFLTTSNNVFIRETAPNKDILDIFHKIGTIKDFKKLKKIPENNFPLVDAVTGRDKKFAWVLYVRAKERGSVAEELHGLIFWGTKMLYLCANYPKEEAVKAGVSLNNYQKYLTNSKKYLTGELDEKLRELRDMYHLAHRGEGDFDAMLEQYILKA